MAKCLEFIAKQRWLFAIFLLPISFLYDIYWYLRSKWILFRGSAADKHQEKVDFVQKQVLDWQTIGNGRKMCTARPTWMSITQQKITYKDNAYQVKVNLMDILSVDTEEKFVRCEPLVTVQRLVEALTPQGWIVPIGDSFLFLSVLYNRWRSFKFTLLRYIEGSNVGRLRIWARALRRWTLRGRSLRGRARALKGRTLQ